jgi:hypothetical protein
MTMGWIALNRSLPGTLLAGAALDLNQPLIPPTVTVNARDQRSLSLEERMALTVLEHEHGEERLGESSRESQLSGILIGNCRLPNYRLLAGVETNPREFVYRGIIGITGQELQIANKENGGLWLLNILAHRGLATTTKPFRPSAPCIAVDRFPASKFAE